ncbi:MAG TPA: class I SAM-dependent methyltransferase [Candidatus Binatia bacterium]
MFEVAEAYEEMVGRWSRQLAPLFVEFAGVRDGDIVLDVGCGTGALSATLARVTGASKIVGIDPSNGFIEYARTQVADPRVTFELAMRKICHTRTGLLTDAWHYSLLTLSRMLRRQRMKCTE